MRWVTLVGPDRWAHGWITNGERAPLQVRDQQSGGGVLAWAAIIKVEEVGPFRVEDELKINSHTYCLFLEDSFINQWYRKKSIAFRKAMIFMQDYVLFHASKYSTAWLNSKDLKYDLFLFFAWLKSYWELVDPIHIWDLQWEETMHLFE